jgi:hypothetical protein
MAIRDKEPEPLGCITTRHRVRHRSKPSALELDLDPGRAHRGAPRLDSLRAAFDAYLQLVASKTQGLRSGFQSRGGLTVLLNRESKRQIVESLERRAQFKELVRLTRSAFPDSYLSGLHEHVGHFFRRRGAYDQYLEEQEVDAASLFAAFEGAFRQREMLVRYLAPLERVGFSRDHLDCGSFSIRRFSREELDKVLQTALNSVFYPAADTEHLCHYWFVVAEERQPAQDPSHVFYLPVDLDRAGHVFVSYRPPPDPIERALQVLSLFDWERAKWSLSATGEWGRFHLPFVILTNDALLRAPYRWWCDGRWALDAPACAGRPAPRESRERGRLGEDASSELEKFSRDTGSVLAQCIPPPPARDPEKEGDQKDHPWYFFEKAITYLVRAFQTEGLDQILWHMVAIEALVGGKSNELVTESISRRLERLMLDPTIADEFKKLWDLRCRMVHGERNLGTPLSRAQERFLGTLPGRTRVLGSLPGTDLAAIRQLARGAILRFAQWLAARRRGYPPDDPSRWPSRDQLLSDLDSGTAQSKVFRITYQTEAELIARLEAKLAELR